MFRARLNHENFAFTPIFAQDAIRSDKKYSGKKLDTISALILIESALNSNETVQKSFVFKLASSIVAAGVILKFDQK